MRGKIRTIIVMGLLFGIALLVIKIIFRLSDEEVWNYYIICSVVIIIGAVLFSLIWQVRLSSKLNNLIKILYEEENPDKFIEESERMLKTLKSRYVREIIKINLCTGYCEKEDYMTAREVLQSVSVEQLKKIHKTIYYASLAFVYFRLEENDKALDILEKQKQEFASLEEAPNMGGSIAILKIYQQIAANQIEEAQDFLVQSKEKWPDKRLLRDWEYLQRKISALNEGD